MEDHAPAGLKGPARAQEAFVEPGQRGRPKRTSSSASFFAQRPQRTVADRRHRAPQRCARARSIAASSSTSTFAEGGGLGDRPPLRGRPRSTTRSGQWPAARARAATTADGDPLGPRLPVHVVGLQRERPDASGCIGSMGTVGDCYDNAPMESFWGSMQIELLNRQSW